MIIENGAGNGNKMRVDANNRGHTLAVGQDASAWATSQGDAYNINTGTITLTDATESAILYFKNNEVQDFIVEAIAIGVGEVTAAANTVITATIVKDVTGSSFSTDVDMNANRNFGSAKTLTADAFKGTQGATLTGGSDAIMFFMGSGTSRLFAQVGFRVAAGQAFGINLDVQDATGAQCYAAIVGHLADANESL